MKKEIELQLIKRLLKENKLPFEDLVSSKVEFITLFSDTILKGCIGIETFGKNALLRSFVVADDFKNQGLGNTLLNSLVLKSKNEGIEKLHLLTTTADAYFTKKGFIVSDRKTAPKSIINSKEFSEICPASSVYMVKLI